MLLNNDLRKSTDIDIVSNVSNVTSATHNMTNLLAFSSRLNTIVSGILLAGRDQ